MKHFPLLCTRERAQIKSLESSAFTFWRGRDLFVCANKAFVCVCAFFFFSLWAAGKTSWMQFNGRPFESGCCRTHTEVQSVAASASEAI